MKLVRFGAKGKEKPGLIDKEGKLRDLSGVIADITPEQLAPAALLAPMTRRIRTCRWRSWNWPTVI